MSTPPINPRGAPLTNNPWDSPNLFLLDDSFFLTERISSSAQPVFSSFNPIEHQPGFPVFDTSSLDALNRSASLEIPEEILPSSFGSDQEQLDRQHHLRTPPPGFDSAWDSPLLDNLDGTGTQSMMIDSESLSIDLTGKRPFDPTPMIMYVAPPERMSGLRRPEPVRQQAPQEIDSMPASAQPTASRKRKSRELSPENLTKTNEFLRGGVNSAEEIIKALSEKNSSLERELKKQLSEKYSFKKQLRLIKNQLDLANGRILSLQNQLAVENPVSGNSSQGAPQLWRETQRMSPHHTAVRHRLREENKPESLEAQFRSAKEQILYLQNQLAFNATDSDMLNQLREENNSLREKEIRYLENQLAFKTPSDALNQLREENNSLREKGTLLFDEVDKLRWENLSLKAKSQLLNDQRKERDKKTKSLEFQLGLAKEQNLPKELPFQSPASQEMASGNRSQEAPHTASQSAMRIDPTSSGLLKPGPSGQGSSSQKSADEIGSLKEQVRLAKNQLRLARETNQNGNSSSDHEIKSLKEQVDLAKNQLRLTTDQFRSARERNQLDLEREQILHLQSNFSVVPK